MSENLFNNSGVNEAVCVDTGRVYDSCMDRDCIENIRVYFSEEGQTAIQTAISAKVKCCEVTDVQIDVEPVAFNRGYYSCDLTFYFTLKAEVILEPYGTPTEYCGVAFCSKKVILCGSEGSVKTFTSTMSVCSDDQVNRSTNLPKCTVQTVDPVILDSKICEICCPTTVQINLPESVTSSCVGEVVQTGTKGLYITLGLFTIVQLVRNVQLLIPTYDFCLPQKECSVTNDSPCDVFSKIKFPMDEFFPKSCESHCCAKDCDH